MTAREPAESACASYEDGQMRPGHARLSGNSDFNQPLMSLPGAFDLSSVRELFRTDPRTASSTEWLWVIIVACFFAVLLTTLIFKGLPAIEGQPDFHFHQAFLDYDFNWKTPSFALAGNFLYNFGIQIPLNSHLAPIIGLAHALSGKHYIIIALVLFSASLAALFWFVGNDFGLRPAPRAVFAGAVALIVTVPYGLDNILFIVPPLFLTHLLLCGLWWGEASVLAVTAAYLFFRMGQHSGTIHNLLLGALFCVVCYAVLLAFAEGAFFIAPVIALYCIAFVSTARGKELIWKGSLICVSAAAMLPMGIPSYFRNLYSYTYGAYFSQQLWLANAKVDFLSLLKGSMMATALSYDLRVPIFVAIAILTAGLCFLRGTGAARRIACAVLFVEASIVLIGMLNALTFRYPIGLFYSEVLHEPFLAAFFVLGILMVAGALYSHARHWLTRALALGNSSYRDIAVKLSKAAIPLLLLLAITRAFALPTALSFHLYPAKQPPSVDVLKAAIALKPGERFPGRVLILGGMSGRSGRQWPGGDGSIIDVLESQYKVTLGNDHYINLLPFGISVVNEFAHWTSPVTFVFLRSFFGRREDVVDNKSFFPLRKFDLKVARLMGVRMVVSDAASLPGGNLVYETKAGTADLRIFELEDVNLGQYSPRQPRKIATASDAVTAIRNSSFDPQRDVLVENELTETLVPASNVSVTTDLGAALSVRGRSRGRSLLVLPFEYSHCLYMDSRSPTAPQLIPVNMQQTGILFDNALDVKVSYRFGLFGRQCRHDDIERADRMRLRQALDD